MEAAPRGPRHVVRSSGARPKRSGCWAKDHCDFLLDAIDAQLCHLQAQGSPMDINSSHGAAQGTVVVCHPTDSAVSAVEDSPSEEGAQEEAHGLDLEGDQSGLDSVCTEELAAVFQAGMVDPQLNSESEGDEDAIPRHPSTKDRGQAAWSPFSKEPPPWHRTGSLSSLGDKISLLSQTDTDEAAVEALRHHPPWRKGHQPLDSGEWGSLAANNAGKASWWGRNSSEAMSEWVRAQSENPSRPLLVGDLDPLEMDALPTKNGDVSARVAQPHSLETGHAHCLAAHLGSQNGPWAPLGGEGQGGLLPPGRCSPSESDRTGEKPVFLRRKCNTGRMDLAGPSWTSLVFAGSGHDVGALCPEGCREAPAPMKAASVDLGGRGEQPGLSKGQRQCPDRQLHQTRGLAVQLQLRTAYGMMLHKEASQLASEKEALEDRIQQLEAQLSSLKLQLRNSNVELAALKEMAGKTKQIQEAVLLEREEELLRLQETVEALGVESEARSRAVARLAEEKVGQLAALRQEAQREKEEELLRLREELRREKQQALQELAEKMEQASARALGEQAARFRLDAKDLRKAIAEREARLFCQEDAHQQKAKALKQEAQEMVQKALLGERERWEADARAALWALREQNQKALLRLREALAEERRATRALWERVGGLCALSAPGSDRADPPVPRPPWPLEGHPTWKAQMALEFKEELKAEMERRRSKDKPMASRKERERPPVSAGNAFHSPWLSDMLSSPWPFAASDLLGRLQSRIRERQAEKAVCCCANRETLGGFHDDLDKSCASQGPSAGDPSS